MNGLFGGCTAHPDTDSDESGSEDGSSDFESHVPTGSFLRAADKPVSELEAHREEANSGSTDGVQWLNDLMLRLWPRIDTYVKNMLKDDIQPSIQKKLPSMVSFAFTKVTLGKAAPRFGPMTVGQRQTDEEIRIRLGLDLATELEIDISCAKVPIGLRKLLIRGVLTVVLRPAQMKPPFFGGYEVYFANPPQIDIDFLGAASIAEVPGLRGMIRTAIASAVNSKLVLPSRIAGDLNTDDETTKGMMTMPDPVGIVRLTLKSGDNLKAMDTGFMGLRAQASDPYVVIEAGQSPWTSPVVQANLNPVWTADNVKDILIYDDAQEVRMHIWDHDAVGADDDMGVVKGVPLVEFMTPSAKPVPRTLKVEDQGGTLTVTTEFLKLTDKGPSKLPGAKLFLPLTFRMQS
jgi:Ca2+-dependent lipid-binding protein